MDKYYIPQHLDTPAKILLWTLDEAFLFLFPFLIFFIFFNAMFTGLIIGIVAVGMMKKVKGEEGHYFLSHLAYWYLPPLVMYKATPPSHIREYLG